MYYLLGNYNCFQMHMKPFGKEGSDVGISCFEQQIQLEEGAGKQLMMKREENSLARRQLMLKRSNALFVPGYG